MRMYDEIREAALTFPTDVPVSPALADLLRGMLAKDAAQRLSMPQVMAHPWVTHNGAAPLQCLQVNSLTWILSVCKLPFAVHVQASACLDGSTSAMPSTQRVPAVELSFNHFHCALPYPASRRFLPLLAAESVKAG
jgi:serine/threonine protein kinase